MDTSDAILNVDESLTHEELVEQYGFDPLLGTHRTDDPDVWGLRDVARGRTPSSPTTIYKIAGDSASGVVGILTPSGDFLVKAHTRIGRSFTAGLLHDVLPMEGEPVIEYETQWDGAAPELPSMTPMEDGTSELRAGHSKGLLLGVYEVRDVYSEDEAEERLQPAGKNKTRYDKPSKLMRAA